GRRLLGSQPATDHLRARRDKRYSNQHDYRGNNQRRPGINMLKPLRLRRRKQAAGSDSRLDRFEIIREIAGVDVAPRWLLRHRLLNNSFQLFRNLWVEHPERNRILMQDLVRGGNVTVGDKRVVSGEVFVQYNAERKDIGAAVRCLLEQHLGRHVRWRAS